MCSAFPSSCSAGRLMALRRARRFAVSAIHGGSPVWRPGRSLASDGFSADPTLLMITTVKKVRAKVPLSKADMNRLIRRLSFDLLFMHPFLLQDCPTNKQSVFSIGEGGGQVFWQ